MLEKSTKCPHCGLVNPATASVCDCGYGFASQKLGSPPSARDREPLTVAEKEALFFGNFESNLALEQGFGARKREEANRLNTVWLVAGVALLAFLYLLSYLAKKG